MSLIFDKSQPAVSLRLKELENRLEGVVSAKYKEFIYLAENGVSGQRSVKKYNLDYLIRIGYMFNGEAAENFQVWATEHLAPPFLMK